MKQISAQELKEKIDNGEKLNIIDVREPAEYAEYNLGGKLVPLGKIAGMQLEDIEDLKEEELIIHCKGGTRSMQACLILEQAGFSNVANLTGGVTAFKNL
ncbi:MAG TPA: rhodanese-like domain-containing protein [Flavobacterium sp.]|nr:rhodanese-like domain-containing protein [Flavobacterium sp.]